MTPGNQWLKSQQASAAAPLRWLRLLAPITGLLIVAQAWLLAHVIDAVAFRDAGLRDVSLWLALLPAVFGLRFIAGWLSARLGFRAAQAIKIDIRARLFDKLRRLGPIGLGHDNSGALATRIVDGVEALDGYFARYVPAMIMMSMLPLMILLVVFPCDWISGLVLLLTAPLVPLFMTLIGKSAERRNQAQWVQLTRMGSYFLNVIQTLPTLKSFNASRRELERIARVSDAFRQVTMSVLRLAFLTSAVLEFFASISIALIAVFIGFRLLDNEMPFLYGFFVLLLAPEFYLPLRNLGVQNHARMEAAAAAEQIADLLERPDQPLPLSAPDNIQFQGTLRIQQVHYAYDGQRRALNGLDLEITPGEHIAIVGPSGSGKSTLVSLLLGFMWPDSGQILVGDLPLAQDNIQAWRRQLGWIPQRAHLFHGTLLDNIRLGMPDASMDAVMNACEAARALPFIQALPQGLETPVGEGGQGLSGGQVQRIAIARALVRNSPWLLLDEPSAHLDPESERLVTQALDDLGEGRTVISIAHRLQSVRKADRIVVMRDGRVIQSGGFEQLAKTPGAFRELLEAGGELLT